MAWIRVDDQFDDHPKHAAAGPLGWALWLAGLAYCNRNLTDGFIPWAAARKLVAWEFLAPDGTAYSVAVTTAGGESGPASADLVIGLLVAAGLWLELEHGYRVHDYAVYQPLKADIERRRELKTERQRRWRERQAEDVDASTAASTDGTTDASVDGLRDALETPQPKPKPKKRNPTLTGGGVAADVDVSVDASTTHQQAIFQAFMDTFYPTIPHQRLTRSARGELNQAVKDLIAIEAGPTEIGPKAERYRERMPDVECTPSALVKHWHRVDQERPSRPLTNADREYLEHVERTRPQSGPDGKRTSPA